MHQVVLVLLRYDKLKTIEQWTFIEVRKQEKEIEEAFDIHSVEKNFHEWGARVTEAMKIVSQVGYYLYGPRLVTICCQFTCFSSPQIILTKHFLYFLPFFV
jgi:hypothetical protein